jgi:ferredoxin|tara:strand:+ start:3525 stop:3827 length:303 start_codon:yes stop_codon:yes gene_type:complete
MISIYDDRDGLGQVPQSMSAIVTINEVQSFTYGEEFSLLDSMEKQQIPMTYSCRGGYCGSCKVKLTAGRVNWVQDGLVPLEADEILVCCCVPDGSISLTI